LLRSQLLPRRAFNHRPSPAIMIVGALVLVEMIAGITKASMTR
jgi:hypothetical protein